MRILVVGCGSIGRRHIRLLKEMGVQVVAAESDTVRAERAKTDFGIDVFADYEEVLVDRDIECDGVIVATPPNAHFGPTYCAVRQYAREGLSMQVVLVEKPLSVDLHEAEELCDGAIEGGTKLLVGYNLRYHPGLIRLKQLLDDGAIGTVRCATILCGSYLPDWRPGFDYRKGYAAFREQGGGVLLDCSHEIDLANWLFGEPVEVSCVAHNTGALEIETEDVADMAIRFAGGVQANIHLDYLNEHYRRECEVVGDKGTLQWRFHDGGAVVWQPRHEAAFQAYAPGRDADWTPDDMYRAELTHFLNCIRGTEQPRCTGHEGLIALRVALAAKESAQTGKLVRL